MIKRRDETSMMNLIVQIASADERIRAVIMNGSRTSPAAEKDIFQDYDIVYLVTDVPSFVKDRQWIKKFGDILIMQRPDEMDGKWPKFQDEYAFLMQFKDWNRIDLTLLQVDKFAVMSRDSQSILLLDKDNRIQKFDPPSDNDYLPHPPSAKEFHDCCNEFLWVSTYVVKGICRKELTYAKYVSEQIVKEQLIKLLTWTAGLKTNYQFTMGKYGKYLEKYIEQDIWQQFKDTYVDANYENMWESLCRMCELFNDLALKLSKHFGYEYNENEYREVVEYLHAVKNDGVRHANLHA